MIAEPVGHYCFLPRSRRCFDINDLDGVDDAIRQLSSCYLQLPTDETKAQAAKQSESATDNEISAYFC